MWHLSGSLFGAILTILQLIVDLLSHHPVARGYDWLMWFLSAWYEVLWKATCEWKSTSLTEFGHFWLQIESMLHITTLKLEISLGAKAYLMFYQIAWGFIWSESEDSDSVSSSHAQTKHTVSIEVLIYGENAVKYVRVVSVKSEKKCPKLHLQWRSSCDPKYKTPQLQWHGDKETHLLAYFFWIKAVCHPS